MFNVGDRVIIEDGESFIRMDTVWAVAADKSFALTDCRDWRFNEYGESVDDRDRTSVVLASPENLARLHLHDARRSAAHLIVEMERFIDRAKSADDILPLIDAIRASLTPKD
jgi:hypothetical protein